MKYLVERFSCDPSQTLSNIRLEIAKQLGLGATSIQIEILNRKLEYANQTMRMVCDISVDTNERVPNATGRLLPEMNSVCVGEYKAKDTPVIVGAGLSGLYAGLKLALAGARPIVLEQSQEPQKNVITPQNRDISFATAGFFGRNGAVLMRDRSPHSEELFRRLVKLNRISPTNKDYYLFLSPDACVSLAMDMVADIRKLGGEVIYEAKWVDIKYLLGKVSKVSYIKNQKEELIKTSHVLFAIGAIEHASSVCLKNAGIRLQRAKNQLGLAIEYPIGEFNYTFLRESHPEWPLFFIKDHFLNRTGRSMHFSGPYLNGALHAHGTMARNELRLALDAKEATTAIFMLSMTLDPEETKFIAADDGVPFFFQNNMRVDKPTSAPVESVSDFISKTSPWKLNQCKPSYKNGIFMEDLHRFLPNYVSDAFQSSLQFLSNKYPLLSSPNGLVYGFVEGRGSHEEIELHDYETNKKGIFAIPSNQNLSLNLNITLASSSEAVDHLLQNL